MPQRLRLALVLPIVQVVMTAMLTLWADRVTWLLVGDGNRVPGAFVHLHLLVISLRLIWRGVNAPTYPLCAAGSTVGELFYFLAVAVLWYFVGRSIDQRRCLQPTASYEGQKRKTTVAVLTLVWGIVLLSLGIIESHRQVSASFRVEAGVIRALFFPWGSILVAIATRKLLRTGRQQKQGFQAPTDRRGL